jgi:hypothetical protein
VRDEIRASRARVPRRSRPSGAARIAAASARYASCHGGDRALFAYLPRLRRIGLRNLELAFPDRSLATRRLHQSAQSGQFDKDMRKKLA